MVSFLTKQFQKLYVPLTWSIVIQVLLCLPGSDLPDAGLFEIPHLDKIVHVIIFGVFVGLWCVYFHARTPDPGKLKRLFFYIFLIAAVNGIIIEYVQFHFVPQRSFDEGDIIADILSASIAYGICNVRLLSTR